MSKEREIRDSIRKISHVQSVQIFSAVVESVSNDVCTVKYNNSVFTNVPITSTIDDSETKLKVVPVIGSIVTVIDSSGEWRDLQILKFSEVESIRLNAEQITINGGDNGGLILIEKLTEQINRLEDKLKEHQHAYIPYPGGVAGTPVQTTLGSTATPPDLTLEFVNTERNELENTKIKH